MPNYGVIDLGSNSVRLVVYEVKDDRRAVYTNKDFRSLLNDKVMAGLAAYAVSYTHLPGEAFELLVVHGGAAGNVLHLEHVARRRLARRHDLLGVVAEEHERPPVGRAHVAVLLRHLVVRVALRFFRVVDHLEAQPRKVALVKRCLLYTSRCV